MLLYARHDPVARARRDIPEMVCDRKAECEFPEVPTSLQRPAGRPLRTHQKGHYVFGFNPNVGIRRAPHPVVFTICPGSHTSANGLRFFWLEMGDVEGLKAPLSV